MALSDVHGINESGNYLYLCHILYCLWLYLENSTYLILIVILFCLQYVLITVQTVLHSLIEFQLKNGIIDRLSKILCRPEEDLVNLCLRLLYNLSFDTSARLEMVSKGVLNKIVGLLGELKSQFVFLTNNG